MLSFSKPRRGDMSPLRGFEKKGGLLFYTYYAPTELRTDVFSTT
jgi:hypothetical protein